MPGKVYVISRLGHPLMPCSPAKARHLLDDGKAKVVKRTPFTIKLLYGSTEYTQPVILGGGRRKQDHRPVCKYDEGGIVCCRGHAKE